MSHVNAPRYLYLHGFASSPTSRKAVVLGEHLKKRGVTLEALDLRVPTLETLKLSTMIDVTCRAIGDARDRAILIGSSLGALTAARAAEREPRVCALVLLAPAFGMVGRWKKRVGDDGMKQWKETGWLTMPPDPEGPPRLHYDFIVDAEMIEAACGVYADVRVPTIVIHGRNDDVVPIEMSRKFVERKPHMHLVEVDDGHPLYNSLDVVCRELDRWVT